MDATRNFSVSHAFMIYLTLALIYTAECGESSGVDIGMMCSKDSECHAGNGGQYSKCHKSSSTCICTVNIKGHNKCNLFEDNSYRSLYKYRSMSSLECSQENDVLAYVDYPGFFQMQINDFAGTIVNDKKTSSCFDAKRAYNTLPEGIVIKNSNVHGSGAFTNILIKKGTIFGPAKGFFAKGNVSKESSPWSWQTKDNGTDQDLWIDGRHIFLSNWLRFINMAPTAESLNMMHFHYQGLFYYYVFRSIHPGTELLSHYGENTKLARKIGKYNSPFYLYDNADGFVGGYCNNTGQECKNDPNSLCFGFICGCANGFSRRQSSCVKDGTLGGLCTGADGELCDNDINTECQRGVCVCTKATSFVKGKCVSDETNGGRCSGPYGFRCILDANAECIEGICHCNYASTEIHGKCMKNEMLGGRCAVGQQGKPCQLDKDSICNNGLCVHVETCKEPRKDEVVDSSTKEHSIAEKAPPISKTMTAM